jgi:hypothetical protein
VLKDDLPESIRRVEQNVVNDPIIFSKGETAKRAGGVDGEDSSHGLSW